MTTLGLPQVPYSVQTITNNMLQESDFNSGYNNGIDACKAGQSYEESLELLKMGYSLEYLRGLKAAYEEYEPG